MLAKKLFSVDGRSYFHIYERGQLMENFKTAHKLKEIIL